MLKTQLLEIIANGENFGEVMPVPQTNMESLDKARLENYLKDFVTIHHNPSLGSGRGDTKSASI